MVNKRPLFFRSFAISLFVVFILNTLANYFFWYSSMKQFDMVMHFLGGFTAALFSFWFFYKKCVLWIESGDKAKFARVLLLLVLVIALLWEVLEYVVQAFFDVQILATLPDSLSDIVMGFLGGILGVLYLLQKYKNERKKDPFTI